jgi:hypothetical protein
MKKKLTDPATIRINQATLRRIHQHGRMDDILDDVINRALDALERDQQTT